MSTMDHKGTTVKLLIQKYNLIARNVTTDATIQGVDLDSRYISPHHAFAALPGAHHHGAEFASQAIANGASIILTDEAGAEIIAHQCVEHTHFPLIISDSITEDVGRISAEIYGNPTATMKLIGITGTSGKTTTTYLTAAALKYQHDVGVIGTVEMRIGDKQFPSTLTTPQAPHLQRILTLMHQEGAPSTVMEVSSHALEQKRVLGCNFQIAAFTNLSHDHLDYHASMEEYYAAKKALFTPTYGNPLPVVVIDDKWGERLAGELAQHPQLVTVGTLPDSTALWKAGPSQVVRGGQEFTFTDPEGNTHTAFISIPGRYNVANALVAIAIGVSYGNPISTVIENIAHVKVPGRLELIDKGQPYTAIVDYAHKPGALSAVLDTMADTLPDVTESARLIVVFGAGGNRDTTKRSIMGNIAAHKADIVIVTDDNPRDEDPKAIRQEILRGAHEASGKAQICEISPRDKAIEYACSIAQAGDIIVVAGKGHEQGQEINGKKYPFDDKAQVSAAISNRTETEGNT